MKFGAKKRFIILAFFMITAISSWAQIESKEKIVYDTLILRDICDYCHGENSTYFPRKFASNTKCICYDLFLQVDSFIANNKNTIKYLKIENPSNVIFKIDFEDFSQLNTLSIFGNDFDVIKTLPPYLLRLKSLKNILVEGVGIPSTEIKRLKKEYPKINFDNKIPEYDKSWEHPTPNSDKQTLDMTLIVKKNNKYALWEFPYKQNPAYIYDNINKENEGAYICSNDSGVDFIQTTTHTRAHFDFYQTTYLNGNNFHPIYFANNGGKKEIAAIHKFRSFPFLNEDGNAFKDTTIEVTDTMIYYRGGKSGLLNSSFETIIPIKYDEIWVPVSDIVTDAAYNPAVNIERPYHTSWIEFGEIFNELNAFSLETNELIIIKENASYGASNFSGQIVIPFIYSMLAPIKDDSLPFFALKPNSKYDIYDYQNRIIKSGELPKSVVFSKTENPNALNINTATYDIKKDSLIQTIVQLARKGKIVSYDSVYCRTQTNRFPFEVSTIQISTSIIGNRTTKSMDPIPFSITLIDKKNEIEVSYKLDELKTIAILLSNEALLKSLIEIDAWAKNTYR